MPKIVDKVAWSNKNYRYVADVSPDFVVNLSPIVTTLKHLKKCNYVDNPVGPNVSIALGGSIFFNEALACVRP